MADQPGYDLVTTTAFELIGVGLLALLASTSDNVGSLVIILMAGFLIIWALTNTAWLQSIFGTSSKLQSPAVKSS